MLCRRRIVLGRSERGLYFPINHRIADRRVAPSVAEACDIQARRRRELRTSFTTGATRQAEAPAWSEAIRPTHFLSLGLPTRNSLSIRVKDMQDTIVFSHQHAAKLFVPIPKLHVTVGVMSLPEENSAKVLGDIHECVEEACQRVCGGGPLRLRFRGLGTFNHGRVLFARCIAEENFTTLDKLIREVRRDVGLGLGVDMKGNPHDSYVPHVTIAKIRAHQREEFGRSISAEIWAPYQHHDFGDVTFAKLDVCSMKGKGENGYYQVASSVAIGR